MKIKNLIAQLETALETAKAILAEQTPVEVKKYVHRDGWWDKGISHIEIEDGKAFKVRKDGTREGDIWERKDFEGFIRKGIWIPMPEPVKSSVKVRRFKHRDGENAFIGGRGKKNCYGTYVEEKDGKYFLVLKNGYRNPAAWTKEEVEMFLKEGYWIEVK